MTALAMLALTLMGASASLPSLSEPLTVQDCVKLAFAQSAELNQAEAKVTQYEALLAEVESVYYPKLQGITYLTPMFTVHGDAIDFERRWKSLKNWGPYTHLQAVLALPLYTFGRAEAMEDAARERIAVEAARVREAELTVALEVKRFYYLHLYARTMQAPLKAAAESVRTALEKGQEMYESGSGEISQADLMKLTYGRTEVDKYILEADYGAALALAALKHTMGLSDEVQLTLAEERLPELPDELPETLAQLIVESAERRPEWQQLAHGKAAAANLAKAEARANFPVLFAAGQLTFDWTPMRDDIANPYVYDIYNQIVGGVALGFMFDLDPARAAARTQGAEAISRELEALEQFAKTGIPLRVRKAVSDRDRTRKLAEFSEEGVRATKKWMAFTAAQYLTGTGEAKDLLEGLVAYLSARKSHAQAVHDYLLSRAELEYAIGRQ